jgi:hypothetical protein
LLPVRAKGDLIVARAVKAVDGAKKKFKTVDLDTITEAE